MKMELLDQDSIDFSKVSELFVRTYPEKANHFTADYFEWKYKHCFSGPTRIAAVFDDGNLIGQGSVFEHHAYAGKRRLRIAQLGDLATHPQYRSLKLVREIYRGLAELLDENEFDLCLTIPNDRSTSLNKRFLKLETFAEFPFHVSLAPLHRHWKSKCTTMPVSEAKSDYSASNDEILGFQFPRELAVIENRCAGAIGSDFIHVDGGAKLVTRAKRIFGIPSFIVLTAIPPKCDGPCNFQPLVAHAARFHRTPVFVTWGNGQPFERILSSSVYQRALSRKMIVQVRDNQSLLSSTVTIELIDLDIDL